MGIRLPASAALRVGLVNVLSSSNFSTTSSSYTDLLDEDTGEPVALEFTKQAAGTTLYIFASVGFGTGSTGSNRTFWVGINDGTSDHDLGRTRSIDNNAGNTVVGCIALTSQPAGLVTLTLRVRRVSSGTLVSGSAQNNMIFAWEV